MMNLENDDYQRLVRRVAADIEKDLFTSSSFSTFTNVPSTSTNVPPTSLDWDGMIRAVKNVTRTAPRLEFYQSNFAVELDKEQPTRDEVRERTLKERFLSWPWKPWVKTKTVRVANYKPCMYRMGNKVIYHPSLEATIRQLVEAWNN